MTNQTRFPIPYPKRKPDLPDYDETFADAMPVNRAEAMALALAFLLPLLTIAFVLGAILGRAQQCSPF